MRMIWASWRSVLHYIVLDQILPLVLRNLRPYKVWKKKTEFGAADARYVPQTTSRKIAERCPAVKLRNRENKIICKEVSTTLATTLIPSPMMVRA